MFGRVDPAATVTPVVSSADGGLVTRRAGTASGTTATRLVVPAKSVTTFLVDGVRGVAKDAALVQPGHAYRLAGRPERTVARTRGRRLPHRRRHPDDRPDPRRAALVRTPLTGGHSNRDRYAIANADNGRRLAVRADRAVLEDPAPGAIDAAAQWIMSTTGDGTWTFVNVGSRPAARRGGTGDRGRQSGVDLHADLGRQPALVGRRRDGAGNATGRRRTPFPAGVPTLPDTVTPVYRDGARGELPVTWTLPPTSHGGGSRAPYASGASRPIRSAAGSGPRRSSRSTRSRATEPGARQDLRRWAARTAGHGGRAWATTAEGRTCR